MYKDHPGTQDGIKMFQNMRIAVKPEPENEFTLNVKIGEIRCRVTLLVNAFSHNCGLPENTDKQYIFLQMLVPYPQCERKPGVLVSKTFF
jgi:hypothetical protein